mmetsp:Transcript_35878/g.76556  ORF Transcript_35878/g.76556 Transcript_35878/m.76556 type:complete len:80 (-) Transcript_35878:26-265(-)
MGEEVQQEQLELHDEEEEEVDRGCHSGSRCVGNNSVFCCGHEWAVETDSTASSVKQGRAASRRMPSGLRRPELQSQRAL